jgi:hypothetical protein
MTNNIVPKSDNEITKKKLLDKKKNLKSPMSYEQWRKEGKKFLPKEKLIKTCFGCKFFLEAIIFITSDFFFLKNYNKQLLRFSLMFCY